MTHVVAEPCFACKYTDCVVVCPVECFYEGEKMLYIHPDECIDCEACVPECPVEAIFPQFSVPPQWQHFIEVNSQRATALKRAGLGHITHRAAPLNGPECVQDRPRSPT